MRYSTNTSEINFFQKRNHKYPLINWSIFWYSAPTIRKCWVSLNHTLTNFFSRGYARKLTLTNLFSWGYARKLFRCGTIYIDSKVHLRFINSFTVAICSKEYNHIHCCFLQKHMTNSKIRHDYCVKNKRTYI